FMELGNLWQPAGSCPMGQVFLICFGAPLPTSTRFSGCQAFRSSSSTANQVRDGHQPQDGQDAGTGSAARLARPRRRGDRITMSVAAAHEVSKSHIAARTCATTRSQLTKADTAFQAHPLVNR